MPGTTSVQNALVATETPTPVVGYYGIPNVTIKLRKVGATPPVEVETTTDALGYYHIDKPAD